MKPTEILRDVRIAVVDGGIAGLYAGRLLSDFGAEVTLLEPADGLALRRRSKGPDGVTGPLFRHLAAGMQSVVCDDQLASPAAVATIEQSHAVIIDGLGIRGADAAGTYTGRCRALNAAANVVTITPFGLDTDDPGRPATEFTLQARAGSTGSRGTDMTELYAAGGRLGEWFSGCSAAVSVLASIGPVDAPCTGASLDVSMLEAMVLTMNPYEWIRGAIQDPPSRIGPWTDVPSVERVADGWVGFAIVTPAQWTAFVEMTESTELAADPSWGVRMSNRSGLRDLIDRAAGPWLARHTVAEVVDESRRRRIPVTEIGNGATLLDFDHLRTRAMFSPAADGSFIRPAPPYRVDGLRPVRDDRAPALDEHRPSPAAGRRHASDSTGLPRPLEGVRVLDLTAFLAGPQATWVLGILGAEIIKVEGPRNPDGMRRASARPRTTPEWWEYSPIYQGTNGGKADIVLDFATPFGREQLLKMLPRFDVVIENFHPDVIESHQLGYETLRQARDDIVMVRQPAFGLDGPWRDGRAFAPTMDQVAGLAWLTGPAHRPPITPRAFSDTNAAWHSITAVLAALRRRAHTGQGAFIELAAIEASVTIAAEQIVEYSAHGVLLERQGNADSSAVEQGLYRLADGEIAAVTVRDHVDSTNLQDRFGASTSLAEALAGLASTEADKLFRALGIPFEVVVYPSDVTDDPILVERRYFAHLPHRVLGTVASPALPFTLNGNRMAPATASPTFGQHNDLLRELTGTEVSALVDAGVTSDVPAL